MKALITGGTGGIGSALVRAFSEFYDVVLLYHSADKIADELCNELHCNAVKCDITDEKEVQDIAETLLKSYNNFDVIINNAGVSQIKLFSDITANEWRKMIDVNLTGAFNVTKAFLPPMISRGSGSIINISSVWGVCGASCEVHYSTTKAGLIGFTKAMAKELAPSSITVNAIAPGVIDTGNVGMNSNFTKEELAELENEIPLGRLGRGEDIAKTALFLTSAKYITGEVIVVDGGFIG